MKVQLISAILLLTFFLSPVGLSQNHPYTILISLDGFRWDYTERGLTPNLKKLAEEGVKALSLKPVFPSKTFPNHYSIITGMYPENHGIVANTFKNYETGVTFKLSDRDQVRNPDWYKGEAFWETAKKNQIISASLFWPGSEVNNPNRRPHYFMHYWHEMPYHDRIDSIMAWIKLPHQVRPSFLTMYFDSPDTYGHQFGPNSDEINSTIASVDSLIGKLLTLLGKAGLKDSTNIIIVSDHGMAELSEEREIVIEDMLSGINYDLIPTKTMFLLNVDEKQTEDAYKILKSGSNHYEVYKKQDIPGHYNFSDNPGISNLVIIADPGWSLLTASDRDKKRSYASMGDHGFDNNHLDMHGIFIASGPSFKTNYKTGTLFNIDIYPLLCSIYGIEVSDRIDGKIDRISFVLKER